MIAHPRHNIQSKQLHLNTARKTVDKEVKNLGKS